MAALLLADKPVNRNKANIFGYTALMNAVFCEDASIVMLLLADEPVNRNSWLADWNGWHHRTLEQACLHI